MRVNLRKSLFILPNMLTVSSIFCGFQAIVLSSGSAKGMPSDADLYRASLLIIFAMFFDTIDGRVARLTKTQSAFGAEYDSLSDVISFGAAPALVVYEWALRDMGKLGWIAAFVYVAGAALRLARFNTLLEVADKRWFQGLPSPSAAALVAGFVFVMDDYGVDPQAVRWWAFAVTLFAGLTMVTNLKYWSFKTINLRRSYPFVAIFLIVLSFALLSYQPAIVLFAAFVAYALSGYAVSAWLAMRRGRVGTQA